MDFKVRIEKDGKFFFIESTDYPVFSQGKTKSEAKVNFVKAFLAYANDIDAHNMYPELAQFAEAVPEYRFELTLPLRKVSTYEQAAHLIRQRLAQNFV